MAGEYAALWRRSIEDPAGFWAEAAQAVDWSKPFDKVLDDRAAPTYRWFAGGEANTCHNCLDRHVDAGRGAQPALIYDSPITGAKATFTYAQMRDRVAKTAGMLTHLGVGKGDRVIIYMPMVPEAVFGMLACARIGAIHSVVFGGFAATELATRIDDAKPAVILSASCGIEPGRIVPYKPLLDEALRLATHHPRATVILQRPQQGAAMRDGLDHDWASLEHDSAPEPCVPVGANEPLYILYTSGTTGKPKGIVREAGGHMVALKWTMGHFYGVEPGSVYWAASDIGWVVGHSYIVYAPLLHGCTTVLFEGKPVGTPDAGVFWRVIQEHKVGCLFTAPTALRAIKKEDPEAKLLHGYDISSLKALFLAGERCDPPSQQWAMDILKVPVIDHWWQTETGWAICGIPMGVERLPVKLGSTAVPMPGYDVRVLGADGHVAKPGEIGALAIKLPMPPSCLQTLWQADQRYRDSYLADYPGYYKAGDAGVIDEDGYVHVLARTDDIINVAGHRLSTGGMEEVIARHRDVAECAVVGAADALKGMVPLGLMVLKTGVNRPKDEITREVVQLVRDTIGPVAAFKHATVVDRLPKTRSGKILRGTIQKIADGEEYPLPSTIDDPACLPEIERSLAEIGYGKRG